MKKYLKNPTPDNVECIEKAALISAQLEQYEKAIYYFERASRFDFGHERSKHLFHSVLCHMLHNEEQNSIPSVFERYSQWHDFRDSFYYRTLRDMHEHFSSRDMNRFTMSVRTHNSRSLLTEWEATMMLRIKNILFPIAVPAPVIEYTREISAAVP